MEMQVYNKLTVSTYYYYVIVTKPMQENKEMKPSQLIQDLHPI